MCEMFVCVANRDVVSLQRTDSGRASSDLLDGDVRLPSAGHSGPRYER